jgi:hypothetical protein
MLNPIQLEEFYQQYAQDLGKWVHDGITNVDLALLHDFGILDSFEEEEDDPDDLTQYFHVIESPEKVTLFNEQFSVWIVPKSEEENPSTMVLIALNQNEKPHLEIVFNTSGVYNTPKYVLKVLQHFLVDMLETEETLTSIEKNQ